MLIVPGVAFIIFAALIEFAEFTVVASAFVVGIGLVVLGVLIGERFPTRS